MSDHSAPSTPTTLRRQLGARLRALRQERNLTAEQVARDLGVSVSKVSRMETGARAVGQDDMTALVDYFELAPEEASRLGEIAQAGRRRRTPTAYPAVADADPMKIAQMGFVDLERDAEAIREFNSGVVPGLLQSREYMRSLIAAALPSDTGGVEKAIDLRIERQQRLSGGRPYRVIIDEAVLARGVGGAAAMCRQVELIARRMDEGVVDLRVVPFDAGSYPGLNSMFVSLELGRHNVGDIVFLEGPAGYQKFEKREEFERFDRLWQQILQFALDGLDSRDMILRYIEDYRRKATLLSGCR